MQIKCTNNFENVPNEFFITRQIDKRYVKDGIVEFMDEWEPSVPVFIDAPTGSGKNTFVLEECMKRASEAKMNCLLLSNRVAASTQQKRKIAQLYCPELLKELTDYGLLRREDFGNIKVLNYQGLYSFFKKTDNLKFKDNLMYVIIDEAHFFTSDCMFNENCEYILNSIVRRFSSAIRIYLSATSYDALYPITIVENEKFTTVLTTQPYQEPRYGLRYYFARNFKNCSIDFFHSEAQLLSMVNNPSSNKWLIFVSNKEIGKSLSKAVSRSCTYIDAEQKNGKEWENLISQEKFDTDILITTSVLDNGVNIFDDDLINIAIFSDERTEIMQMFGRKRRPNNEKVNLWIYNLTKNNATKRLNSLKRLMRWYELFDNCHTDSENIKLMRRVWNEENNAIRDLFHAGHIMRENSIVRYYLQRRIGFYEEISSNRKTFENIVKEWFGETVLQQEKRIVLLTDFCEKHLALVLDENNCKRLRTLIMDAYEEAGFSELQKSRIHSLKHNALNNRLLQLKLNYKITANECGWILSKAEDVAL